MASFSPMKNRARVMFVAAGLLLASGGESAAQPGRPTPAGYWEGNVSTREVPMKDPNKSLTRSVEADFWFNVKWDRERNIGYVTGEGNAKYDAELKVDNLPKVTAPAPGGGSVKFEPSVGGKLTESDNRRKFGIIGVLQVDLATGQGTLVLQKASPPPPGSRQQQLDDEAKGVRGPDAPMEFVMRADPGVSGGIGGAAGSINYDKGRVGGATKFGKDGKGTMSEGVDTGLSTAIIVKKIPMAPFSPFRDTPGKVEKRPNGPFAASFEERGEKFAVKWNAKQMGGEQRTPVLTPEMMRQIEELLRIMREPR